MRESAGDMSDPAGDMGDTAGDMIDTRVGMSDTGGERTNRSPAREQGDHPRID
jgi:hypothetical protein